MDNKIHKSPAQQIPRHTLSDNGRHQSLFFVKRFGAENHGEMKSYAHRDDYYLFVFITKGSALLAIDFREISVKADEILLVTPSQIHVPVDASDDAEGWILGIASELFTDSDAELATLYAIDPDVIRPEACDLPGLTSMLEMLERHTARDTVARSLTSAIKNVALMPVGTNSRNANNRYLGITLRLKRLLADRLTTTKSPSDYASTLNISEVYLNEAVKAVTGMSVGRFIRHNVALSAKRQLLYTELTAREIAFRLGYDDYAHFSKLFRKETGMSPVQFRKTLNRTSFPSVPTTPGQKSYRNFATKKSQNEQDRKT